MKLYGYWRSSSTWRVRIALAHKNLEHQYVAVHLRHGEQTAADFRERNPMAQVPLLEVEEASGTLRLGQSMAILEYIEERFPVPPLLPSNALERARVRQLAEIVNSGIQPLQNLAVLQRLKNDGADPRAWARHFIGAGLGALEALARTTAGRYLAGEVVTLADVFLVPQLYNARRFAVDLESFETLLRVEKECEALEAFQRAHPDAQVDREPDAP